MYLNKAIIVGNLTRDPELRALPSGGNSVASFSIATNRVWYNQDKQKQEATEFHNIVVFGKQAESCAQYLKKGSNALIEGRLQTRSWEKDGAKQYRTEIVADHVQFGFRPKSETTDEPQTQEENADVEFPTEEISPDDIPF